ncbi:hypothetical protein MTO96_015554 [Rhipicephalus appendiculatus]
MRKVKAGLFSLVRSKPRAPERQEGSLASQSVGPLSGSQSLETNPPSFDDADDATYTVPLRLLEVRRTRHLGAMASEFGWHAPPHFGSQLSRFDRPVIPLG